MIFVDSKLLLVKILQQVKWPGKFPRKTRQELRQVSESSCRFQGIVIWVFPKIGVPQNGWFIMDKTIKMDDLGVPLFLETSIFFRRVKTS